ncbi:MAG: WG repeat-containing protein [Clostridia bacterium]|nr:WG repeat-containing protein [Clostridia bacterium]
MKKKISILLAALLLCTSMVACNEQPYMGDDESETTTQCPEKEDDDSDDDEPISSDDEPVTDGDKPISSDDEPDTDEDGPTIQENKYTKIKCIVAACDDVYIFQNYNGMYGLLSTDGDIIYEGFYLNQCFNEFSNYLSCRNKNAYAWEGSSEILDKNGNSVLAVGENNIEFISDITQGRIFAYQMTDEKPSGKTYDLICYSAKDMSEVFRVSDIDEISGYIDFDETGYCDYGYSHQNVVDIHGNIYRYENWKYYDSNGNEYTERYNVGYDPLISERYGLPVVSGIEPCIDRDIWYDLVDSYEEYENASDRTFEVGITQNTLGQIATLYMNTTSTWYATMDANGNILMEPTKDIWLGASEFDLCVFSNDLCCAYQPSSGLWGYVDPYGNWKIAPQYESVTAFSYAGLAVVNDLVVIDTTGKIVMDISDQGDVHTLEGTYQLSGTSGYSSCCLTFSKDGTIVESGWHDTTGTYEVRGDSLIVDAWDSVIPTLYEGVHTLEQNDDALIIDGELWVRTDNE